MADMTQLATLGNLQRVVENMKVYVDSDKTTSIKGYLKKNNTHNFYNTSTPTEDTTPIFSFDVGEEMSLDQTNTTFVQEFEWSDENYPNSTNPNLDGQAVLVLATKSNDVVSYSFVNLETLVDTYKTKNTTTLSLDITDNEISGNVNISAEDGNAVVVKDDGLYVPTTAEIKVSETDGNIIEVKDDGIYVAPTDLDDYSTTDEVKELIKEELYTENTIAAHYEITDSTAPNALEVVADGTATDGQIDLSNVEDIGANIGDYVVFVDETTITDTKYAEKTSVYSKSETDEKIAEAVTGGTVSLDGYVQKTELETTLEDYTTDDELSTALADYTKTTDLETQLEDYVLDSDMEIIDLATLESMLGLSTEELEGLSQIIDDSSVRIDKTNSSSFIYQSIQDAIATGKEFTLSEIAKASTASYKVVDNTSSVTDSKYIYLIANSSNSYDMYILDDVNGATRIGETTIDLSGYLTTETASQTYVLQTVFDVLSGNIGDVTTLQTSDKTLVGAVNELKIAIDNATVEISSETNNLLEEKEDGLFVGSETVTISKADYDALSIEEKSNGKTYFVPDDETTEDGTDLTQFAKVSDLEETNNKIEEINTDLGKKLSLSGGEMSGGIEMKGNTIGSVGDIFLNDKGAFLNALLTNMSNNLAQLIKTTTVTASADISANSSVFMRVSPPETPSGYRDLFAFIQGGSGSIDTSQLLVGSGTTGCRVYNNLSQKQTVTIECRIVYIKNC